MQGDAVSRKGSTRHFDHRTYAIFDGITQFAKEFFCFSTDDFLLCLELITNTGERYHDFRTADDAFFLQFECCAQDGACLHLSDFGIGVTQTATTVSKHRVLFFQ